jgi:hypothetical protein
MVYPEDANNRDSVISAFKASYDRRPTVDETEDWASRYPSFADEIWSTTGYSDDTRKMAEGRARPGSAPVSPEERPRMLGPGRFRLLARAQMHGDVKEPGYVFTLLDGELGPHKSIVHTHDTVDVGADSKRISGRVEDVPLYEPYEDADADTVVEGEHGYPVSAAAIEKRDEELSDANANAEERAKRAERRREGRPRAASPDAAPLREDLVTYGDRASPPVDPEPPRQMPAVIEVDEDEEEREALAKDQTIGDASPSNVEHHSI